LSAWSQTSLIPTKQIGCSPIPPLDCDSSSNRCYLDEKYIST
jgi:hypothetical protein